MRFPGEDVSSLTMQQLRAKEGARVRKLYRKMSHEYGVKWNGRTYDPDNFEGGDPVNQALSAANVAIYGLVYSAVTAMGMATGLGFVHSGHDLSFIYDIADLYKAEITVPIAFQIASEGSTEGNYGRIARMKVRDAFADGKVFARIVRDIQVLIGIKAEEQLEVDPLCLWDNKEIELSASCGKIRISNKRFEAVEGDKTIYSIDFIPLSYIPFTYLKDTQSILLHNGKDPVINANFRSYKYVYENPECLYTFKDLKHLAEFAKMLNYVNLTRIDALNNSISIFILST